MTQTAAALPRQVVRGLRREAFRQIQSDPRRVAFPTVIRAGRLDAWPSQQRALEVPRAVSAAWAYDVIESLLLTRCAAGLTDLWLTRPGEPSADHLDRRWQRSLREVEAAYALPAHRMFVITRTGWVQILDDADPPPGQRWSRLRLVLPAA